MNLLTDLERLARAAITHEPSDHGKLSAVRMRVWQEALDDFHDEAHPERVLQLLDVIEAAKAIRSESTYRASTVAEERFDAAIAALEKEQK